VGRVTWAVARRPDLWAHALGALFAFARPGWWRRVPFLPVPDRDYMAFRRFTAYGSTDHPLDPSDVVAFLEWRRAVMS
jgi:hypothetical protein